MVTTLIIPPTSTLVEVREDKTDPVYVILVLIMDFLIAFHVASQSQQVLSGLEIILLR